MSNTESEFVEIPECWGVFSEKGILQYCFRNLKDLEKYGTTINPKHKVKKIYVKKDGE